MKKMPKYIVKTGLRTDGQQPYFETYDDLKRFLATDPFPKYRLVGFEHSQPSGVFFTVWERKDV